MYLVDFNVSITAGVGSAVAVAVNGVVNPMSYTFLVATGQVTGSVALNLAAGDMITLRNNSAIPLTMMLAPSTGATLNITRIS